MLKNIFFLLFFFLVTNSFAQKKMTPISQSSLTGISLPNGSKQDSRMLSVAGAKILLEMESKKANVSLSSPEVLLLPPAAAGGFNADSLVKNLSDQGWAVSVIEGDNKYAWLQKDNRNLIMYFSMNAKETGLYFAEAASAPVQNGGGNTTGTIQTAPTETNQTQQTTNTVVQTNQPEVVQTNQTEVVQQPTTPVTNSGFAFNTTNFDDGWTATVQENWVEVTKGTTRVLIHYPNKQADAYNSVLMDGLKNAWNILVAPRYSSASNFEFKPLTGWQSIEFAEADLTENGTSRTVHVVLFKMNYSNGSGRYLEFITPDKNSFEQEFGAYHQTTYGWEKMENMAFRNRFAIAASDLTGKWTNNFSGSVQYVNVNTGFDAGTATHASAENFLFTAGNTYKWDLGVASGMVGNIKFQSVKSNGRFSLPSNWQISFSDMEGKPRTFNAYFSSIKGFRILWLDDKAYGKIE